VHSINIGAFFEMEIFMKSIFIILVSCFFAFACKSKKDITYTQQSEQNVFLSLERTPCYGTCENFKVIIYSNGYCTYEGKNFVEKIGKYESVIDKKKIELIKNKATEINYFSLENSYNHTGITDIPATITEIFINDKSKRIENRYRGPQELKDFELYIEGIINDLPWKKINE
jgi:hypothetical protein